MAAPIEIIIRQQGTSGVEGTGSSNTPNAKKPAESVEGQESPLQAQVNTLMIDYGKRILQEGTNVYLDYSGNTILAEQIQEGVSVGASILAVARGGALGGFAVAFDTTTKIIQHNKEISRQNQQIQFLRNQSGKIIELGGRYTND